MPVMSRQPEAGMRGGGGAIGGEGGIAGPHSPKIAQLTHDGWSTNGFYSLDSWSRRGDSV